MCGMPKCAAIRPPCVPLPAPGGAIISTRMLITPCHHRACCVAPAISPAVTLAMTGTTIVQRLVCLQHHAAGQDAGRRNARAAGIVGDPGRPGSAAETCQCCCNAAAALSGCPVDAFRNSFWFGFWVKSNMDWIDPAAVSAAPLPMAGRPQLYSMNFTTELRSMNVLSIQFGRAHGEISRNGSRGPTPHLPCSGWPAELTGTWLSWLPHMPVPVSASIEVCDWVTTGPSTWSYQPSESSQVTTTAVDDQLFGDSRWLMVLVGQACSSGGSEYPAC